MKKVTAVILIICFVVMMVILLTSCESKTIIATKSNEDASMGKYEEKIEIDFDNKKVKDVKLIYTFETKENAENVYGLYKLFIEGEITLNEEEKSVTIIMSPEKFFETDNCKEMSKKEIKEFLENKGYNVK